MHDEQCQGSHRYFVADVAQVTAEGKVVIIAMCTACGDTKVSTHQVASREFKEN